MRKLLLAAPILALSCQAAQALTVREGSNGDDYLVGTNGPEELRGRMGGDYLNGRGGNDRVRGGRGGDVIGGGPGNDRLEGYTGPDMFLFHDHDYPPDHLAGGLDTIIDFKRGEDYLSILLDGLSPGPSGADNFAELDSDHDRKIDDGDARAALHTAVVDGVRKTSLVIDLSGVSPRWPYLKIVVFGVAELGIDEVLFIELDDLKLTDPGFRAAVRYENEGRYR